MIYFIELQMKLLQMKYPLIYNMIVSLVFENTKILKGLASRGVTSPCVSQGVAHSPLTPYNDATIMSHFEILVAKKITF